MEQMEVAPFAQETGLQHFIKNAEWDVKSFQAEQRTVHYSCCKEPFTEVVYHLHLKRKTLYYMYTMVMPVTTITSLIAIGFCLPPNSGERIILSVTILVSMTVYLNIASKRLPVSSDNIPLLSLFYLMLFAQIALSLAASTFVLANFYRENFSKPIPTWFRWLVFDNLSGFLCGTKLEKRPSAGFRGKQRRKTVRFSDVVTINGSATSISSKESKSVPNGNANGSALNKQDDTPDSVLLTRQANEGNATKERPMNGSIHHDEGIAAGHINLYENMLEERIAEEMGKRQTQQLICDQIDVLTKDVYEKEKKKETILEWQYASTIIDRAFFVIFIFTLTLALSFFLLHKIPYLSDGNV